MSFHVQGAEEEEGERQVLTYGSYVRLFQEREECRVMVEVKDLITGQLGAGPYQRGGLNASTSGHWFQVLPPGDFASERAFRRAMKGVGCQTAKEQVEMLAQFDDYFENNLESLARQMGQPVSYGAQLQFILAET